MIIYDNLAFQIEKPCAVAIGKFEGLHLGHRAILDALVEKKKEGYLIGVLTFYPGPDRYFSPDKREEVLISEEEKEEVLAEIGVDILVRLPFDKRMAEMSAEEFLKNILLGKMNAAYLVAGKDVAFGNQCRGNADFLKKHEKEWGYQAILLDKKMVDGKEVSSSRIRVCLTEGRISEANALLGYPFHLNGEVEKGHQFGRVMGYPTCNITLEEGKFLPPFGVYYTYVYVGNECYEAMTNVGVRPTVSESGRISVESFLLNFEGNIYGEKIRVEFLHHSREEKRFEGPEVLTKQLRQDEEGAREYFRSLKCSE